MNHNKKGKTLDRKKAPREALLRGLATSLILYEQIKTTKGKAKALRPIVEKFITLAKSTKQAKLHVKRQLSSYFYNEKAVKKLVEVIGPKYLERAGGYTRIIKAGQRQGDGADIAIIQLV